MHHLEGCDKNYIPSLSERVNIKEYSEKIADKAVTFEAWDKDKLVGLAAVYLNMMSLSAFVTNVSVLKDYSGNGVASQLMLNCIQYASQKKIGRICLEVDQNNAKAMHLYKRLNFMHYDTKGETKLMELKIND